MLAGLMNFLLNDCFLFQSLSIQTVSQLSGRKQSCLCLPSREPVDGWEEDGSRLAELLSVAWMSELLISSGLQHDLPSALFLAGAAFAGHPVSSLWLCLSGAPCVWHLDPQGEECLGNAIPENIPNNLEVLKGVMERPRPQTQSSTPPSTPPFTAETLATF